MPNYTVVLVVRRFQMVGGMESYVCHLANALDRLGVHVLIVCAECDTNSGYSDQLVVKVVRSLRFGSSWLRLLVFSRSAASFLRSVQLGPMIVHSHERTPAHHITTFHGPPFALIRTRPFWSRWSLRVLAYLWMERREVCAPNVLAVVPNSSNISYTLAHHYPCIGGRLRRPIPPGVQEIPRRGFRAVPSDGGVVGFVGKEWRRKGLEAVIAICAHLWFARPKLVLRVYGPDPTEIQHFAPGCSFAVQCMGWRDAKPELHELDLLLHPARSEPYGMVISEAMAAQVPVVVSDACGAAADVSALNGSVLPVHSPLEDWARACERMLSLTEAVPAFRRSWDDVAREYVALYEEVAIKLAAGKPER